LNRESKFNVEVGEPTGELVVITLAVPLSGYRKLSAIARARQTSVPRFLVQGLNWFLTKLDEAEKLSSSQ